MAVPRGGLAGALAVALDRRRAVVQRARLWRRDARAAPAAGRAAAHRRASSRARDRRSSTNTKSTPTVISCATGAPVEPAEYRSVTLPLRDGVASDQGRLGRPRLLPALDARTLPLDRHRALAGRKPSAVDLPPRLAGALLPALAAPGAPQSAASSSTFPSANRTRCPTAARRVRADASRCALSTRWRSPRARSCSASPARRKPSTRASSPTSDAAPIVARGDQTLWPGTWFHELPARTLTPAAPGTAVSPYRRRRHTALRAVARRELQPAALKSASTAATWATSRTSSLRLGGYAPVANVLLDPGVHTFALTYPTPTSPPAAPTTISPRSRRSRCSRRARPADCWKSRRRRRRGSADVRSTGSSWSPGERPRVDLVRVDPLSTLQRRLALPEAQELDVDGVDRLRVHAEILAGKPMLAGVFTECHELAHVARP